MRTKLSALLIVASLSLTGCGYNTMQAQDEGVKAKWSEVVNQYQRRADLVGQMIKTVEAEAQFERAVLTEVVQARASATGIQATPELINDQAAFNKFIAAQDKMNGSLGRLLATVENYPNLKTNEAFAQMRTSVEGTENRITVARKNYIDSVQQYNTTLRSFPNNLTAMVLGYQTKANFTVSNEAEISVAPKIDINTGVKKP